MDFHVPHHLRLPPLPTMISLGDLGGAGNAGMNRDQAIAHAQNMVASMHAAGRRSVAEAKQRRDAQAAKDKEEDYHSKLVDDAAQLLMLDIGEESDRMDLLRSKGVSEDHIALALQIVRHEEQKAAFEERRQAAIRRRIEDLESDKGCEGWRGSPQYVVTGSAAAKEVAAKREEADKINCAGKNSATERVLELVREGVVDLELPVEEAIADARETFLDASGRDAAHVDWDRVKEAGRAFLLEREQEREEGEED